MGPVRGRAAHHRPVDAHPDRRAARHVPGLAQQPFTSQYKQGRDGATVVHLRRCALPRGLRRRRAACPRRLPAVQSPQRHLHARTPRRGRGRIRLGRPQRASLQDQTYRGQRASALRNPAGRQHRGRQQVHRLPARWQRRLDRNAGRPLPGQHHHGQLRTLCAFRCGPPFPPERQHHRPVRHPGRGDRDRYPGGHLHFQFVRPDIRYLRIPPQRIRKPAPPGRNGAQPRHPGQADLGRPGSGRPGRHPEEAAPDCQSVAHRDDDRTHPRDPDPLALHRQPQRPVALGHGIWSLPAGREPAVPQLPHGQRGHGVLRGRARSDLDGIRDRKVVFHQPERSRRHPRPERLPVGNVKEHRRHSRPGV